MITNYADDEYPPDDEYAETKTTAEVPASAT